LRQATAAADAQDPGWRLEDLEAARQTPPPGQNAAERTAAVIKLLPQRWFDTAQDALLRELHPPALLNDRQSAAVQALLRAAGPEVLAQARSLIETPRGRYAIQWSPNVFATILK